MNNFIYLAIWPFDVIGDAIATFFYYILLWFNAVIYSLISFIYQIFLVLAQGTDIFDDSVIEGLTSRIYVIIGVVILFLVAYSLLKSMVNPDEALKGKKSVATIVKDVIISIVLIAVVPYIFDFAFQFQDSLLRNNTIGKIVAGTTDDGSENAETIANGGYIMASTIWQAFLYPADGYCRTSNEENNGYFDVTHDPCEVLELDDGRTYGDLWEEAEDNTTFFALTSLGKFIVNGQLNYLFIVDAATGIFVLFVLLSYCIDTALRLVKLAVFQLIAPIPIFARILPNEQANKVFGNWIKATISTFIEVFIRIAILYFAVIIITSITRSIDDILFSSFKGSASFMVVGIAKVMIIVGIILFIKQAPQIIKDITGLDSGKYNVLGSAMRGLSSMGALTTGAVRGFTTGFDKNHMGSSIARGAKNALLGGAKSFSGAAQKDYKNISDIRKNSSAAVNDVIDKQRRKASDKLAKKQELEEYRNDMTQGEHEPDFIYKARSTKLGSRFGKMGHDVKEGVTDWATSGGLEALKQKRDQIAEVQKAAADVWSIANKEVKSSHEKFYAKDGTRLDELANSVAFYEAQMSNVKASDVLTNRYSELQEKLLNEKDVMQQSILRSQIKEVQDQIDADIEEKRKAANAKLIEYQEKLREGEKWATQFAIDVTAAGKTGDDQVEINGVMRNVEVIGGLSAAIKKADNLLKQNSAIIQEQNINLPTDGAVVITDQNGDKSERQRKYKDYRNVLGNAVDKLDGDISSYVEKKEKKENK